MNKEIINLNNFQIPVVKGLKYIENYVDTNLDSLLINAPRMQYSLYFEKSMDNHNVENLEEYNLIIFKKNNHKIYLFYPYKQNKIKTTLWYFKIEITDDLGKINVLPGQVLMDSSILNKQKKQIRFPFINILENVTFNKIYV